MLLVQKREHLLANQLEQDQKTNIKNVHLKNIKDKENGVINTGLLLWKTNLNFGKKLKEKHLT